jgi:uncharacterized protein (DUF2147 family)
MRGFLIAILLAAPQALAADISGFWKHADEPGWIEVSLEQGKGTVVRNDKFPERVGREILKDLVADDSQQGRWKGQIFAEKLGEYKDAEITLAEPGRMEIKVKVGFMSRTVEWQRVDEVPAAPAN